MIRRFALALLALVAFTVSSPGIAEAGGSTNACAEANVQLIALRSASGSYDFIVNTFVPSGNKPAGNTKVAASLVLRKHHPYVLLTKPSGVTFISGDYLRLPDPARPGYKTTVRSLRTGHGKLWTYKSKSGGYLDAVIACYHDPQITDSGIPQSGGLG